jgi:hypothetical protein
MKLIETTCKHRIVAGARQKPKLKRIDGGKDAMTKKLDPKRDYLKAVSILEQNLLAENWFYEQVLAKIDENLGGGGESVKQKLNYDFLVHLAQFFFLFSSLDMHDRNSISAFIDAHNAKITKDIERKLVEGSIKERRRAMFRDTRKTKVIESCHSVGRPAFAITELAHFLTDFMSESAATRMIDDLVLARVLSRIDDDRWWATVNRKLIVSDGFLENTYAKSLLFSRQGWKSETDVA